MNALIIDMHVGRRIAELILGPLIAGALCGVFLQINNWAYAVAVVLSIVSGLPAGAQRRSLPGAAARGATGGALWSGALLLANRLLGQSPQVALFDPSIVFVAVSTVLTVVVTVTARHLTVARARP